MRQCDNTIMLKYDNIKTDKNDKTLDQLIMMLQYYYTCNWYWNRWIEVNRV